jgi:hypothetical protein
MDVQAQGEEGSVPTESSSNMNFSSSFLGQLGLPKYEFNPDPKHLFSVGTVTHKKLFPP